MKKQFKTKPGVYLINYICELPSNRAREGTCILSVDKSAPHPTFEQSMHASIRELMSSYTEVLPKDINIIIRSVSKIAE